MEKISGGVHFRLTYIVRWAYIEAMHLSDYMASCGLCDVDVADAIKVSRATVSRIRRGKSRPDWETIQKLREFSAGAVTANDFEQIREDAA